MKKCIYCGGELDELESVCPRCGEDQSEHKTTKDLYQEAYDEFYKDFYNKIKDSDAGCNVFETEDYHEDHGPKKIKSKKNLEESFVTLLKQLDKKSTKKEQSKGENKKKVILSWVIVVVFMFAKPIYKMVDFLDIDRQYEQGMEEVRKEAEENMVKDEHAQFMELLREARGDYQLAQNNSISYEEAYDSCLLVESEPEAQYYMAKMLFEGKVERADSEEETLRLAKIYLEKSAGSDYVYATVEMANYYLEGKYGYKKDAKKAIEYLKKASNYDGKCYYDIAKIYEQYEKYPELGGDKKENDKQALTYYKRGVEYRDPYSEGALGYAYVYGKLGLEKDLDKGIELLKYAIYYDDGFAADTLANIYLEGEVVKKDLQEYRKYKKIADEKGYNK